MEDRILSLRNQFDFFLRGCFKYSFGFRNPSNRQLEVDERARTEVREFLQSLDLPKKPTSIVDIGARNFYLAPLLSALYPGSVIHGIEIDAYRRYQDLRTRAVYGNYYARTTPNCSFHPMDFLDWKTPFDLAICLNPFVTTDPLLSWGLPLKYFQPEALYRHIRNLLLPGGFFLVSHPTKEEEQISLELALTHGFQFCKKTEWHPGPGTLQSQPRFGLLFVGSAKKLSAE